MGFFKDMLSKYGAAGAIKRLRGSFGYASASPVQVVPEFIASKALDDALEELVKFSGGRTRGVLPELRKVEKFLRRQHGLRMSRHVTPDGAPWPPAVFKSRAERLRIPNLNDNGPIRGDSIYNLSWTKIRTANQLDRSRDIVEQVNNSSAMKRGVKEGVFRVPALYRPGLKYGNASTRGSILRYRGFGNTTRVDSINVAGVLFGMLTKYRVSGSATRIVRDGTKAELQYGLNRQASIWARTHQNGGGTFKGKPVPRREFLGMSLGDVRHILGIFQTKIQSILSRRSSPGAV